MVSRKFTRAGALAQLMYDALRKAGLLATVCPLRHPSEVKATRRFAG